MTAAELIRRVLFRDALMLVLDKPAGLAVHAGGKKSVHLGNFLEDLRFGLPHAPELAHRLDRDTSGCLVFGRHRQALKRLGALFAHGRVEKTYWAVVVGAPPGEEGRIDRPLGKINATYGWHMKVDPKGQPSVTEWRLLGKTDRLSWLECRPRTGRTHQIRVHLASIGCPIVGDGIYGKGTASLLAPRLHLHARSIRIPLYPRKPLIEVTAPVAEHMIELLTACGWAGEMRRAG
ncbi:MAG: RNA pseudouridine synthase [Telmatospirillum sp.]|nr:RNA pseudouridine synthase [Telmatospirillum sp.]